MTKRKVPTSLADLRPHPDNPREIDKRALDGLGASILEFGDLSGIVWNRRDGYLVTGHQRLKKIIEIYGADYPLEKLAGIHGEGGRIALPDGDTFVVRIVNWSKNKAAKARIVANSPHIAGMWTEALADQLPDLIADDERLAQDLLLSDLLNDIGVHSEPTTIEEAAKDAATPRTAAGQIWRMGEHRLAIGDCRDPQLVARLFGEDQGASIITDPPYGVAYLDKAQAMNAQGVGFRTDYEEFANDEMSLADTGQLLEDGLRAATAHMAGPVPLFVFGPGGETHIEFRTRVKAAGWFLHQTIVWVKERFVIGRRSYHGQHELIIFGWQQGHGPCPEYHGRRGADVWFAQDETKGPGNYPRLVQDPAGERTDAGALIIRTEPGEGDNAIEQARAAALEIADHEETDVWFVARERGYRHPTQKPVQLYARAIVNHTRPREIVYDPFAGSGTIVLAAEQTGRIARAAELVPIYADVILERYRSLTGQEPELQEERA